LQNRVGGIFCVADAEKDFVLGIILAAEAGEVFIGIGIEPSDWLQIADRRKEAARFLPPPAKEPGCTEDGQPVVDKRDRGQAEKCGSNWGEGDQRDTLNPIPDRDLVTIT
jgi:hypothetical protein